MRLINTEPRLYPTFDDAAGAANLIAAGDPDWTYIAAGNYIDGGDGQMILNGFLIRIFDHHHDFVEYWTS